MQRCIGVVEHIGLPCEKHGEMGREWHHNGDEHRCADCSNDCADMAGFACLVPLTGADIHADHRGDRRAEGRRHDETYRRNVIGYTLPCKNDGAVFLDLVVDEQKAEIQHGARYHRRHANLEQLLYCHKIKPEAVQRKLVFAFC